MWKNKEKNNEWYKLETSNNMRCCKIKKIKNYKKTTVLYDKKKRTIDDEVPLSLSNKGNFIILFGHWLNIKYTILY